MAARESGLRIRYPHRLARPLRLRSFAALLVAPHCFPYLHTTSEGGATAVMTTLVRPAIESSRAVLRWMSIGFPPVLQACRPPDWVLSPNRSNAARARRYSLVSPQLPLHLDRRRRRLPLLRRLISTLLLRPPASVSHAWSGAENQNEARVSGDLAPSRCRPPPYHAPKERTAPLRPLRPLTSLTREARIPHPRPPSLLSADGTGSELRGDTILLAKRGATRIVQRPTSFRRPPLPCTLSSFLYPCSRNFKML
ncbi:hypothetical protein K438DRAFT_1971555 [Mycena galopus ATCC 62051]|nr:hypothetical protein K438DRAFT_1971555 [Mycena galopus ATCC 62051]